jgi:NTP pyrophosphatase (non-canonical NTP hydrolase)
LTGAPRELGILSPQIPLNKPEAMLLDHLWTSNLALRRRFPNGVEPFRIISRLAEECGELSAEVQLWEDQGVKRAKHGDPDPHKLATEVMDVMRAALAVAEYYHVEPELSAAIQGSIERAVTAGLLSRDEADQPVSGRV